MNIIEIKKESDVNTAIQEFMDRSDNFEGVMLMAINKDSSQFITTSTMSGMQKAFLVQFVNAWMNSWFRVSE